MDFTFLEAPYDVIEEPLEKFSKIFKPPYKSWRHSHVTKMDDGKLLVMIEKSVDLIAQHINECGPYDGIVSFS